MGPWARSHKVGGSVEVETLGAMAPGAMGPWRHGLMGAMRHGGRVERGKSGAGGAGGHALGPFKVI